MPTTTGNKKRSNETVPPVQALHRAPPAVVLARFVLAVEKEVGVTVSIGLAANRLMAKLAAATGVTPPAVLAGLQDKPVRHQRVIAPVAMAETVRTILGL